jgi:hypothetical protein
VFAWQSAAHRGNQISPVLNNARQLYIAGFSMATDFNTSGDGHLGWPGELAERKEDPVLTVSAYIERLVAYEYLKKVDMGKVMQAPGVPEWDISRPFRADYCPFKIYRVKEGDGAESIFCATRNFSYNGDLDAGQSPYGDRGFIVFRKGGDGKVFGKADATEPSKIGLLPGRTDYASRNVETPNDYLLPK